MSVFRINEIMANLLNSGGYSRTNRFKVNITLPAAVQNQVGSDIDRMTFNCKSATLPGKNFEISETQYSGGYRHKKAIDTNYSDLELAFYLSEDLIEKQVLDFWQGYIFDPAYQSSRYPDEYFGQIEVQKIPIGKNKSPGPIYVFQDCFPLNVADITQDYETSSTVDIQPATFSYHRWYFRES